MLEMAVKLNHGPSSSNFSMAERVDDDKYGQALTSRVKSGSRAGLANEGGGASSSLTLRVGIPTRSVSEDEAAGGIRVAIAVQDLVAQAIGSFIFFPADMLERDEFEGLDQIGRLPIERQQARHF